MNRLWTITAVCLTALFLFFLPVTARAESISVDAEVGFDGTYLRGSWTPVRVVLRNTGNDLEGSLEVTVKVGQDGKIVYSTPVSLPNDSEKEYTVFARISEAERTISIRLTDVNGKTLQSVKVEGLNPIGENNYLLGLLTDDHPSLGYWKDRMAGNQLFSNYQPISLDASDFPDRREVMSAFSVLILNNFDTTAFRPEQLDTLKDWLEDGGVLIVGSGANGKRTLAGLTGRILPVSTGDIEQWDSLALLEERSGKQVLSDVPLQVLNINAEDGRALLGDGQTALIWLFRKGRGTIYLSAFDLGTEPILSWTGNKLFWENLLSQSLDSKTASRLRNPVEKGQYQGGLGDVLGSIEAMEMPSAILILFLFLFYLALVGPFNYMVLRKIDKREWSWVTIPALSILFAVLIFGLGYNTKGGELIVNTISVVDLDANKQHGKLTNHIGIFTPRRGDYEVEVDRFALLTPGIMHSINSNQGRFTTASATRVEQGNPSRILFDNANIWTMEVFETDSRTVELGSIQSDLYYEMGRVKGTVRNDTLYPLEHLVIFTPSAFVEVGSIAAGESRNLELTLPAVAGNRYSDNIYNMIDSVFPWHSGMTTADSRQDNARRNLLYNLIWSAYDVTRMLPAAQPDIEGSKGVRSMAVSYFAFYEGQPEAGILINGRKPDRTISDGLIMGTMELVVEREGMVSIPPGMLYGRYEEDLSLYTDKSGDYYYTHHPSGYAVFSVDLSPFIHLEDLKVIIGVDLQYGGIIQIYDMEEGDYTYVKEDTIAMDESNFHQYLDSENKAYLKILPAGDTYLETGAPTITLEGREPDAEN